MYKISNTEHDTKDETLRGAELKLAKVGNIRHLYQDPASMSFKNRKEELQFWSQDGISSTVYSSDRNYDYPEDEFPLKVARQMFKEGDGDVIVTSGRDTLGVIVIGRTGDHQVRRLHDCFESHRDHVRELMRKNRTPIPLQRSSNKKFVGNLFDSVDV